MFETDEKIGGAWILMSGCEVVSKLMMSSLGPTHAVKHDTKIAYITTSKLTFSAKQKIGVTAFMSTIQYIKKRVFFSNWAINAPKLST